MKFRPTSVIVCILLLVFLIAPVEASGQNAPGIILAFNDKRVDLAGKPAVWDSDELYVPIEFFTENTAVSYFYDGVSDTLTVYSRYYTLSFNIKNKYCTNQSLDVFNKRAFYINGTFYVPPSFVASQMKLGYRYIVEGSIVRVTDSHAKLSDTELYNKLKSQPSSPSTSPDGTPAVSERAKTVYLTFDGAEVSALDSILDILSSRGVEATFFLTEDQLKQGRSAVRDLILKGHSVGLILQASNPASPEGCVNAANNANDALQLITKFRTRLLRAPESDWPALDNNCRSALVLAGYRLYAQNVNTQNLIGLGYKAFATQVESLVKSKTSNSVVVRLPLTMGCARRLPALLDTLRANGHAFREITETTTPVNPANDTR